MSNDEQPEAVIEKGPWTAHYEDGGCFLKSDDFTHNARMYINGHFYNVRQFIAYAEEIARRLNVAARHKPTADRLAVLEKEHAEKRLRIELAAQTYYERYAQDEADSTHDTGCTEQQSVDARALRDALAAIRGQGDKI